MAAPPFAEARPSAPTRDAYCFSRTFEVLCRTWAHNPTNGVRRSIWCQDTRQTVAPVVTEFPLDKLLSLNGNSLPITLEKGGYRAPLWPLKIDADAGGAVRLGRAAAPAT